jgi:transglutaminase-like putative cysteine protease
MAAQRFLVTVARASLTLGAAIGLARVFGGGSWFPPVLLAAVLPPVIFSITDRHRPRPLLGTVVCAVVGTWLAVVIDNPEQTFAGLPTASSLSSLAQDLADTPHVLRSAVVPVTAVGAALVIAFVATFVAATVTEVLARHLDAPLGAIGPSIALYVAIAALGSGAWAAATACYALAVIAYLLALQHADLSTRRTWFHSRRSRRSQLVAGGATAGALVVAFAIAVGPLFPGARGDPWVDYRRLGRGDAESILNAASPFLSIANKLAQNDDDEVFTVSTDDNQRYRWRVIALDQLTGVGDWGLDAKQGSVSQLEPPISGIRGDRVEQVFRMSGAIDPYWLPAAYRPYSVSLDDAAVLPESSTLFVPRGSLAGASYIVESEVLNPRPSIMQSVTQAELRAEDDATALDAPLPSRVLELVDEIMREAGAATPYDRADALERFFQSGRFTYDQTVDYSSSSRALEQFLLDERRGRRGFCEQFASAFAVLARSVGLPTRVAVGYQPGTQQSDLSFRVTARDAHAWPEVWFGEDIGWYAFEPTPGRADPTTGRGDPNAQPPTTPTTATTTTTAPGTATSAPPGAAPTLPDPDRFRIDPGSASGAGGSGSRALAVIAIGAVVALLAAVVTIVLLIVRAARRTSLRRHDSDPRRRVLGAWVEALERLRAAGVTARPAATSVEFALRYAPAHGAGGAGPPLMGLARLHTAAMFAVEPPSDDDADAAWQHVDEIDTALRQTVPRTERWLTRLRIRRRDRR